jgi:uncharacterized protein (DUF924 family)
MPDASTAILDFWFGELDAAGMPSPDRHALWFKSSAETDRRCRQLFGAQVAQAIAGELDHWIEDDRGLVALVLLLDQFTRNLFRGLPRAFSGDQRALAIARDSIANGRHQSLPAIHQVFLLLPLEHCEKLEIQEECVALFGALAATTGNHRIGDFRRYAIAHRDVIARFGRFPHRNAILGRQSTQAELAHLEKHGGF